MDAYDQIKDILVHTARLGLAERGQDVQSYIRRALKKIRSSDEELASRLGALLSEQSPSRGVTRDAGPSLLPVDSDSRLALLRREFPVELEVDPILPVDAGSHLHQIVSERQKLPELLSSGLTPTRSVLFSGPPGVGKTMSARWIAHTLQLPLLTLDLATVMSSFLGKTGSNIRSVLDYAKGVECVLLLDELDAIAKKRDDQGDVGELKRLVTVLLQEIDHWPSSSLLVAATNHADLLDPAIWRRFDDVIFFTLPDRHLRTRMIELAFGRDVSSIEGLLPILTELWDGQSNSDILRTVNWVRRRAALGDIQLQEALLESTGRHFKALPAPERKKAATRLAKLNIADRKISAATGVSRDTLRKYRASSAFTVTSPD